MVNSGVSDTRDVRIRADFHVHSIDDACFGCDQKTVKDVVMAAIRKRLQCIAITDHDNPDIGIRLKSFAEASKLPLLVIPGSEVTSRDGHILAINTYKRIKPGMSARETINIIRKLGGLAIAAHPDYPALLTEDFDAYEHHNCCHGTYDPGYDGSPKTSSTDAHSAMELLSYPCYTEVDVDEVSVKDVLDAIRFGRIKPVVLPHGVPHTRREWE